MTDQVNQESSERPWRTIRPEVIMKALDALSTRNRPSSLYRIRTCSMRTSRRTEDSLFWAQVCLTNLKSKILDDMWDDLGNYQTRTFPFHKLKDSPRTRPDTHSYRPGRGFTAFLLRRLIALRDQAWVKGGRVGRILTNVIYNYYNSREGFSEKDFPVTSTLRESVYQDVATRILTWTWQVRNFERKARHSEQDEQYTRQPVHAAARIKVYREAGNPHLALFHLIIDTHQTYQHLFKEYDESCRCVLPLERYQHRSLDNVGRHEVRRALERLPEKDVAQTILDAVNILLNEDDYLPSEVEKAKTIRHPYKRHPKRQRRLRAGYVDQHLLKQGKKIQLQQMRYKDQERLYREMHDIVQFTRQLEPIRANIATFLLGRPPSFPKVQYVPETILEDRFHRYQTDLEWFSDAFPSGASPDAWPTYQPWQLEKFESHARDQVAHSAHAAKAPKVHLLSFIRTIYPIPGKSRLSSFALLFWEYTPTRERLEKRYQCRNNVRKESKSTNKRQRRPVSTAVRKKKIERDLSRGSRYRYSLVVSIHGRFAFREGEGRTQAPAKPVRKPTSDVPPHQCHEYFFVNAPYTRFTFSQRSPAMIFQLDLSYEDDDDQLYGEHLLQEIVERQKQVQEQSHSLQCKTRPFKASSYRSRIRQHQPTKRGTAQFCVIKPETTGPRPFFVKIHPIETVIPPAAITTAQVVSAVNKAGHRKFYLHIPFELTVPPVSNPIQNVIAFHPHDDCWSYAVIDPEGHVLEIGDVFVPTHVRRKAGEIYYCDTYVCELANAMVAIAKGCRAFIGVEDIGYLKDQPGAEHDENRERFAMPFAKLMGKLYDRALFAGLPVPHVTWGVPWKNTCGQCGRHLTTGTVTFAPPPTLQCEVCHQARSGAYLWVPILLNPVAIIVHLPGISQIRLSQITLAGIVLGTITRWDDKQIASDNPEVSLPDLAITVVRATDNAITASTYADYLDHAMSNAQMPALWQKFFAEGRGRLHPHRFMGDTLATIQQTLGAIGCVTWSPMLEQQSTVVGLCNASGAFVFPSVEGVNAAGASLVTAMEKEVHPDTLVTAQNVNAYPLIGVSWMRIDKAQTSSRRAADTMDFLYWVLTTGGIQASARGYFPMPQSVSDAVIENLGNCKSDNKKVSQTRESTQPPLIEVIRLSGAGAANPLPIYQQWVVQYRAVCPTINIVFQRVGTPAIASDDAREGAERGNQCVACGRDLYVSMEVDCSRCGTHLLARYNTAIVAARLTQQQLVERFTSNDDQQWDAILMDALECGS